MITKTQLQAIYGAALKRCKNAGYKELITSYAEIVAEEFNVTKEDFLEIPLAMIIENYTQYGNTDIETMLYGKLLKFLEDQEILVEGNKFHEAVILYWNDDNFKIAVASGSIGNPYYRIYLQGDYQMLDTSDLKKIDKIIQQKYM